MAGIVCFRVHASVRAKLKELFPSVPQDPVMVEQVSDEVMAALAEIFPQIVDAKLAGWQPGAQARTATPAVRPPAAGEGLRPAYFGPDPGRGADLGGQGGEDAVAAVLTLTRADATISRTDVMAVTEQVEGHAAAGGQSGPGAGFAAEVLRNGGEPVRVLLAAPGQEQHPDKAARAAEADAGGSWSGDEETATGDEEDDKIAAGGRKTLAGDEDILSYGDKDDVGGPEPGPGGTGNTDGPEQVLAEASPVLVEMANANDAVARGGVGWAGRALADLVNEVAGSARTADDGRAADDCVVLLSRLVGRLYPGQAYGEKGELLLKGGARPARTADDLTVSLAGARHGLAAGAVWRRPGSWDLLAEAVRRSGPESTGLVLLERPGHRPGHAFAVGTEDGEVVQWIDLQAGSQLSTQPPSYAAVFARAVVLNRDGRVVEEALLPVSDADIAALALTDPASREYGAIGLEVETPHTGVQAPVFVARVPNVPDTIRRILAEQLYQAWVARDQKGFKRAQNMVGSLGPDLLQEPRAEKEAGMAEAGQQQPPSGYPGGPGQKDPVSAMPGPAKAVAVEALQFRPHGTGRRLNPADLATENQLDAIARRSEGAGDLPGQPSAGKDAAAGPVAGPPGRDQDVNDLLAAAGQAPVGPEEISRAAGGKAGLAGLVDEVAGTAVGGESAADCLVLLGKLAGRLYPEAYGRHSLRGGARPARTADDLAAGLPGAGHELAPGAAWRRVGSWKSLAEAVEKLPGATVLVLWQRPGAPGHALAVRNEAGEGVQWIELQGAPGSRLGPDAPAYAAEFARAVVLGPDGRVIEEALPPVMDSDVLGLALTDPPSSREYGSLPGGPSRPRKRPAEENSGPGRRPAPPGTAHETPPGTAHDAGHETGRDQLDVLANRGLTLVPVPGDGNCLMNALIRSAPEVFTDDANPGWVRARMREAAEQIIDRPNHAWHEGLDHAIRLSLPGAGGPREYREKILNLLSKDGEWAGPGGDVAPFLAAIAFGLRLTVIYPGGLVHELTTEGAHAVTLVRTLNHWNATAPATARQHGHPGAFGDGRQVPARLVPDEGQQAALAGMGLVLKRLQAGGDSLMKALSRDAPATFVQDLNAGKAREKIASTARKIITQPGHTWHKRVAFSIRSNVAAARAHRADRGGRLGGMSLEEYRQAVFRDLGPADLLDGLDNGDAWDGPVSDVAAFVAAGIYGFHLTVIAPGGERHSYRSELPDVPHITLVQVWYKDDRWHWHVAIPAPGHGPRHAAPAISLPWSAVPTVHQSQQQQFPAIDVASLLRLAEDLVRVRRSDDEQAVEAAAGSLDKALAGISGPEGSGVNNLRALAAYYARYGEPNCVQTVSQTLPNGHRVTLGRWQSDLRAGNIEPPPWVLALVKALGMRLGPRYGEPGIDGKRLATLAGHLADARRSGDERAVKAAAGRLDEALAEIQYGLYVSASVVDEARHLRTAARYYARNGDLTMSRSREEQLPMRTFPGDYEIPTGQWLATLRRRNRKPPLWGVQILAPLDKYWRARLAAPLSAGDHQPQQPQPQRPRPKTFSMVTRTVEEAHQSKRLVREVVEGADSEPLGEEEELRITEWTSTEQGLEPRRESDEAFPWRDHLDPLNKVYEPFAGHEGRLHPDVRVTAVEVEPLTRRLQKLSTDPRMNPLRRPDRLAGGLEQDVQRLLEAIIAGRPRPPRIRARILRPDDLPGHEQALAGQYGTFLTDESLAASPGNRPLLSEGRVLALYPGAVLNDSRATESWAEEHPAFPNYAVSVLNRSARRALTMSSEGFAGVAAFTNTRLTSGGTPDRSRGGINAVFLRIHVKLTDKWRRDRWQTIIALTALDNLYSNANRPGMVIADYGDRYDIHYQPVVRVKPEPDSDPDTSGPRVRPARGSHGGRGGGAVFRADTSHAMARGLSALRKGDIEKTLKLSLDSDGAAYRWWARVLGGKRASLKKPSPAAGYWPDDEETLVDDEEMARLEGKAPAIFELTLTTSAGRASSVIVPTDGAGLSVGTGKMAKAIAASFLERYGPGIPKRAVLTVEVPTDLATQDIAQASMASSRAAASLGHPIHIKLGHWPSPIKLCP